MRRRKPWWIKTISDVSPHAIVRLKSQDGGIGDTWLAREFVRVLEAAGEKGRLSRARACGRNGSGSNLKFSHREMKIGICCSGYTIREVELWFPEFGTDVRDRLVSTVASDAALTGSLLSGDLSEHFLEALKYENIRLVPEKYTDIQTYCNCGDEKKPCIHAAVAWYMLAESLDENPWNLFVLYGLSREEVIRQVTSLREMQTSIPVREIRSVLKGCTDDAPLPIPLSVNPDGFFSMSGDIRSFPVSQFDNYEINPVILLGPAPFSLGGKNLGERIAGLYPAIQKYAGDLGREEK